MKKLLGMNAGLFAAVTSILGAFFLFFAFFVCAYLGITTIIVPLIGALGILVWIYASYKIFYRFAKEPK